MTAPLNHIWNNVNVFARSSFRFLLTSFLLMARSLLLLSFLPPSFLPCSSHRLVVCTCLGLCAYPPLGPSWCFRCCPCGSHWKMNACASLTQNARALALPARTRWKQFCPRPPGCVLKCLSGLSVWPMSSWSSSKAPTLPLSVCWVAFNVWFIGHKECKERIGNLLGMLESPGSGVRCLSALNWTLHIKFPWVIWALLDFAFFQGLTSLVGARRRWCQMFHRNAFVDWLLTKRSGVDVT